MRIFECVQKLNRNHTNLDRSFNAIKRRDLIFRIIRLTLIVPTMLIKNFKRFATVIIPFHLHKITTYLYCLSFWIWYFFLMTLLACLLRFMFRIIFRFAFCVGKIFLSVFIFVICNRFFGEIHHISLEQKSSTL